jgi:glycosyltransferase involved in cell wall biosynthesis
MCKVSVIIPSYNHGRFLDERFRSILSQTYDDYEILFLDDHSTDNSLQVFAKYKDHPKVRSFINTRNSGSTFKQWNKGVRAARGKYVWFAESDDAAEPELLETLVALLDRHPNVGLAYSNSVYVDEDGNREATLDLDYADLHPTRWKSDFLNSGADECVNYLVLRNSIPNASAVVFRRALYERAGYADERMKRAGDWWVWVNILLGSDVAYDSRPLNRFRKPHVQCTRRPPRDHHVSLEEMFQVVARITSRLGFPPSGEERVRRNCLFCYRWVADVFGGAERLGPKVTPRMLDLAAEISPQLFFALVAVGRDRAARASPRPSVETARRDAIPSAPRGSRTARKRSALVIIPGTVNYFYNLCGRRLAEALRELSFEVDLGTLADHPAKEYDWCVLSNIYEVVHAFGDQGAAFAKVRELQRACAVMTQASMESAVTPWYRSIQEYCRALDIRSFLDIGLHDQWEHLRPEERSTYHFLVNGLTTSELRALDAEEADALRTIPWAFVGHCTPDRVALVDYLIREFDPRGFVYLPHLHTPVKERGSPHLNEQQFDAVLLRTRYQIWCSHHEAFYVEGERFRMSLLSGGVAVKVIAGPEHRRATAPFPYLMIEERSLARQLRSFDFEEVRRRFRDDFRAIKPLRDGLADFLTGAGVLERHAAPAAPRPLARAA